MIIHTPAKDFFVKAVVHAKEQRIKELNELEASMIIAEEEFISLRAGGITLPPETFNSLTNKIDDLKKVIKHKKKEIS